MIELQREVRECIEDLYLAYADIIDDGDLASWPELFTDEGSYFIVSKENHDRGLPLALMRCESKGMIEDRVNAILQLSMYAPRVLRHVVGSLHIRSAEDAFAVRANYAVFQTLADDETRVLSTGRYLDVVVVDGDRARFRAKRCVYDNPLVPNSIIYPL